MGSGLAFRKVDLHTHTPASKCFLDKSISADDIVQSAIEKKLDAIAITDHNIGTWIDQVKKAAQNTDLTIFPGVEITVSEGIHVIALFDIDKGSTDVAGLLGALHIKPAEQGKTNAFCKHGIQIVIEKIIDLDGLAILAHIDQIRGAFEEMLPVPLTSLINDAPYHAVETSTGKLPPNLTHNRGFTRFPACYQSSDNPDPTEPKKHSHKGLGTKYSYFKLDKMIDLEGLRQCFADPEVRIRRMGMIEEVLFPKILSLQASEGFLKHQNIRFHCGLNSIIGGKGVGKSLIIELLRFALDQPSSDSDIQRDYNSKLDKRLGPYNYVEIVCQLPSGSQYKIRRVLNDSYECLNLATNQPYNGKISELFPILAYSQTEVIKIAEDEGAQLKLIDSFIDPRPYLGQIETLNRQLADSDLHLAKAVQADDNLASYQRDLDTVNAQITEIDILLESTTEDELLNEFRILENKKIELESLQDYLAQFGKLVAEMFAQMETTLPPVLEPKQLVDADLAWIHQQCQDVHQATVSSLKAAKAKIKQRTLDVNKRITDWRPKFDAKKIEYMAVLEKEQDKQQLEIKRQHLIEQQQNLQEAVENLQELAGQLIKLQTARSELLDKLDKIYQDYFVTRKSIFDTLSRRSEGKLKLELTHSANYQKFQDKLRALVSGSGARKADIETIARKLTPREFVSLAQKRDINGLETQAGISDNSAKKILDKLWSGETIQPLLDLEHSYYPEDVPSIQVRKEEDVYAPLSELSVGQKCTALLIIALSEGTRPVIIDQPEDSLDITTVWEDISKKLRQSKEKRQFILTTHNPSVAVAADSDMFIVIKSNAQQANVKCWGAIEHPDVKKAVIQHLEGGREPYQLRRHKYNM